MTHLNQCKVGEYDPRAAATLCNYSGLAYRPQRVADRRYTAAGYGFRRFTEGGVSVDLAECEDHVLVVFAGTNDLEDWWTNLSVGKVDWQGYQLHEGFHLAEQDAFYHLSSQYDSDLKKVWVAGHSMGGDLATLHALRFADHATGSDVLAGVYTYGAARCMDAKSAHMCDLLMGDRHYRHTHGNDIVPRLPSRLRFKHCGRHVHINRHGNVVRNPSPFYMIYDRVLGYRADWVRNHFQHKYAIPLMRHAK